MDGDVGRFAFTTHSLQQDAGTVDQSAREVFPPLGSKERYLTDGFKELAMISGVTGRSFQPTTTYLTRFRHQEEDG